LANGWNVHVNEHELYHWWQQCVENISKNFIRLGIEMEKS